MEIPHDIELLILKFLRNQVTDEEIRHIHQRLEQDPNFKKTFELLKSEQIALESLVESETKTRVKDWLDAERTTNPRHMTGRLAPWIWVFSLTLLAVLMYLVLQKKNMHKIPLVPSPSVGIDSIIVSIDTSKFITVEKINELKPDYTPTAKVKTPDVKLKPIEEKFTDQDLESYAVEFYQLPLDEGSLRGENNARDQINRIWSQLRLKQYVAADHLLDSINPFNTNEKKYLLGHLRLGQQKYDEAIIQFKMLEGVATFKDAAQWYSMIGTLATGNKQYTLALQRLDQILIDTTHPHHEEAMNLKKRLDQK